MSTLYEIRRGNLRALIRDRGNGEVSKAAGYSTPSYISQMAGPKAHRAVTEHTARRIEDALGLPPLWMDQERDPYGNLVGTREFKKDSPPPADSTIPLTMLDQEQFALCATAVSNAMVAAGAKLPAKKFTAIVTTLLGQSDQSEEALENAAKLLVGLSM